MAKDIKNDAKNISYIKTNNSNYYSHPRDLDLLTLAKKAHKALDDEYYAVVAPRHKP